MTVIIFGITSYNELTRYEIDFENEIVTVTPQLLRKMVKEAAIRGKAYVILLGEHVYYGAKIVDGFQVFRLT